MRYLTTLAMKHRMRKLTLFDSTCLIVGIIIGSGIYETPTQIAGAVEHPWQMFALWIAGGLISLCGAMCYAELSTTYPESGGDVVYLNRAYGKWAGFLFGWLQTFVARPGDISAMALVFSRYIQVLVNPTAQTTPSIWPAIAIVLVLTLANIAGLHFGKSIQNFLTIIKVAGLLMIVGAAMAFPASTATNVPHESSGLGLGVALILVLFAYGGWNEMVYVASEVDNPKRNLSRALFLGTTMVTVLYLTINFAYLRSLTMAGMAGSEALATDAVATALPRGGQMLVAALIAISAAGSINGLVLTGARITGAMRDYRAFSWLGVWNARLQTPVRALVVEGLIAIAVIYFLRTFDSVLIYTSAAVYTFYLATGLSTAVLRRRDPNAERVFRVPFYPLPLIVFVVSCVWMIYSAINYKPKETVVCFIVLVIGAVVYQLMPSPKQDNSAFVR